MKATLKSSAVSAIRVARDARSLLLLAGAVAVIAAGCSGGATGPAFPKPASVAGSWHFTASFNDSPYVAQSSITRCTVAGTATLTEAGDLFSGQMTGTTRSCTGPGASTASWDGPITGGQVVGQSIVFLTRVLPCDWFGNVSASIGSITGTTGSTGCWLPVGSTSQYFTGGTFQMIPNVTPSG